MADQRRPTLDELHAADAKASQEFLDAIKANLPAKPQTNAERDAERKRIDKLEERVLLLSKVASKQTREIAELRATLQTHNNAFAALQRRSSLRRGTAAAHTRDHLNDALERDLISD